MTAKLEINEMFRDMKVAETVGEKLQMGWLEVEFTVYGTAYLKDGEMHYKISSEAGKIYQFMETSLSKDIYCSNIQTFTHMCHVPIGMNEDVLMAVKKTLAARMYHAYPKELFVLLDKIAKHIRNDDGYPLLLEEKDKVESTFDEHKLKDFRVLVHHCYALQRLSQEHYKELLTWLDIEEECMHDSFVTKDIFEKTFYGIAYPLGDNYKYMDDSVLEYTYRKKYELEKEGIWTSPIFEETLWYNYQYTFKDCRKTYDNMFKATMNKELLGKLEALFRKPLVIYSEEILQEMDKLSPEAMETLKRYLKKWNMTM